VGGVATHCYYLTQELQRQGIEVTFFDTFRRDGKKLPSGVRYSIMDYKFWKINLFLFLTEGGNLLMKSVLFAIKFFPCFTYKELIKFFVIIVNLFVLFRHNRPTVIHSHHAYPRSLAAIIIGKHYKIPCVLTIHASELVNKRLIKLAKFVIQNADRVISVSAHTKKLAQRQRITKDIYVIPNGVSFERVDRDDTRPRNKYSLEGKEVILFVGALVARKGPHILIKAIPFIEHNNIKIVFIGPDLGYRQTLEETIKDERLEKKTLIIGEVSHEELNQFYSLGDILVLPTITEDEGFGIVLLEAMSRGIPVIGSNIGGIPEVIIDGETGLLFEPENHIDLAKRINILLNDKSLCQKMGQAGRELANSKFNWTKIAREVKEIYLQCI
jgi:glycosyltransferase involved in cell wall biosynthesis